MHTALSALSSLTKERPNKAGNLPSEGIWGELSLQLSFPALVPRLAQLGRAKSNLVIVRQASS